MMVHYLFLFGWQADDDIRAELPYLKINLQSPAITTVVRTKYGRTPQRWSEAIAAGLYEGCEDGESGS